MKTTDSTMPISRQVRLRVQNGYQLAREAVERQREAARRRTRRTLRNSGRPRAT